MRCGEANALDAGNFSDGGQQLRKAFLSIAIAVRVHVLSEQLNFSVAEIRELTSFSQNRGGRPAAFFSASKGNDAVGAELVAAFDDCDVSPMGIGAGCVFSLEAVFSLAVVKSSDAVSCFDLDQHRRQISIGRRAGNQGNVWCALEDLFALLLCYASEDTENLALRLVFLVIGKPVKNLLLGLVADGAGVIQHEPSFFDSRNLTIPLLLKRADHLFGIVHVHLAAKGF